MISKKTDTPQKADCSSAHCSASWLPIETAPNSLNVILVTDGESVWTDQKLGGYSGVRPGAYYFNGHENWEEVTHWMPIPSLPNSVLTQPDIV
jgi:hypothetical protein